MRRLVHSALEAAAIALVAGGVGLAVNAARGGPRAGDLPPLPPGAACGSEAAAPATLPIPMVDPPEAAGLHGRPGVVFVDARPRADFATARITGAFSVPGDVSADPAVMQAVLAADTVIVYCDRPQCGLSMRAARRLRELGARGVRVLGKGWPAWFAAGFPAQSGGGS